MDDDIEPLLDPNCTNDGGDGPDRVVEKDVDEILATAGGFGRFQFILLIVCMLFSLSTSYQALSMYYAADDPPWQCTSNATSDFCKQYHNQSIPESSSEFGERCRIPRHDWEYTKPRKYSLVTQFHLVCKRKYLKAMFTSSFFISCGVTSIVAGPIADFYGRKVIVVSALLLMSVASVISGFVTAVWQMIFVRVLIGCAFGASKTGVYILLCECNAPKRRGVVCNVYFMAFTLSSLLLTLLAYSLEDWRQILLYCGLLTCACFVLSLGLVESPNWLVVKGRSSKAMEVLLKISKINKRSLSGFVRLAEVVPDEKNARSYSYVDFFNNLKVFILVLAQSWLWMASGLMFYGIALESSKLGGDIYFNFAVSGMADVPANLVSIVTSQYIGRKKVACTSFAFSSVLLCAIGIVPETWTTSRVAVGVASRVLICVGFNTMFLWSFEIFPTVLRSQGMNVCQIFSRGGGAAAPFITDVLKDVNPSLPFFIMAGVGVLAAMIGLVLPETFKKPIRQTYEDMLEGAASSSVVVPVTNTDFGSNEEERE